MPTIAGVAVAGMTAYGLASGADLAPILAASGLVYLGAAALRKPMAAWWVFIGTFVVVGAGKAIGEAALATWLILGLAGAFALYGVVRGALRPAYGLPLQSLAMLAFGAVAAVALAVDASAGAYLVAAGPTEILPKDPIQLQALLDIYLLEKAVYEVGYELNSRPDWVKVPLQGILQLLGEPA